MVYSALSQPSSKVMKAKIDCILREFSPFPVTTAYLTEHVIPLIPQTATSEIPGFTHNRYTNQMVESYNGSAQNTLGGNRSLNPAEIVQRLFKLDEHFHDEVCLFLFCFIYIYFFTFSYRLHLPLRKNV
jgi:hypothetical protein